MGRKRTLGNGLFGGNRYKVIASRREIPYGEALGPTHETLKAKASELIALNSELSIFDPEALRTRQLYNLIWGIVCKLNPRDLQDYLNNVAEKLWQGPDVLEAAVLHDREIRKLIHEIRSIAELSLIGSRLNLLQKIYWRHLRKIWASLIKILY